MGGLERYDCMWVVVHSLLVIYGGKSLVPVPVPLRGRLEPDGSPLHHPNVTLFFVSRISRLSGAHATSRFKTAEHLLTESASESCQDDSVVAANGNETMSLNSPRPYEDCMRTPQEYMRTGNAA
jgi:hypothetical protein